MLRDSLDFLVGVLGTDGARALAKTAQRQPDLMPILVPRTALAWLQDRQSYEGVVPGVQNSYIRFSKAEAGYNGVVALQETNYEFQGVAAEHVAAAVAVAVGSMGSSSPAVRALTLTRLGKSIDALAQAQELCKALPKAVSASEKHKYVAVPGWTADKTPKGEYLPRCKHCGERPGHDNHYAGGQGVDKAELPGQTAKPREQDDAQGPQAPQKQPKTAKPKVSVPKLPALKVEKAEIDRKCPECEWGMFQGNKFKGCCCLLDLAKHVRTTVYSDGLVLEFGAGFDKAAWPILRKALKGG